MSIFTNIMSKIFGSAPAAADTSPADTTATPPGSATPAGGVPNMSSIPPGAASSSTAGAAPAQGTALAAAGPVDVVAVLSAMPNPQKLNWRNSIVDLMKLLGLDSSLDNRKELAKELGYTGDTNDSATMNIWLHKQVMTKLGENGGVVPDDLKN
ncbi:DUF3597 domain-containing protein [Pseudoroseomonas globiformis]|uniref:DUF3597 domain-containing protein n=1 Tax=Teichococcus globiformis TaxID=2307229 RepID=A0ABV7FXX5_9PROT